MPIVLKDAVKLWKKVKPITLTDTGVSGSLRVLNDYERSKVKDEKSGKEWADHLAKLVKDVDKYINDGKIKKHADAVKWLKALKVDLDNEETFIARFRDTLSRKESERKKEEVENKKQEEQEQAKEAEARKHREWAQGLNQALEKLTGLEETLAKMTREGNKILKQIKDETYAPFISMHSTDEIMFLEGGLEEVTKKREQLQKVWTPIEKLVSASKTAPPPVSKVAGEVKALHAKLEKTEGTVGELVKQCRKGEEDWRKESQTDLGKVRTAFKDAEATLIELDKRLDSLIKVIDRDTKDLKDEKMISNHDHNYQSSLDESIEARQKLKPSWFDNMATSRQLAKDDKALLKIMDNVVKLDSGLRANGKEGTAKKKMEALVAARKEYSKKSSKMPPEMAPEVQ